MLDRLRRRPQPGDAPAEVRRAVPLGRGERLLAAAPSSTPLPGTWAVATSRALVLVRTGGGGPEVIERRGWEAVDHGGWSDESRVLEVTWTDGTPPVRLRLDGDDTFVPEVLRERVQSTVVVSRRLDVRGRRGVRVVVRRAAGSGDLFSEVLVDPGVDAADPAVASRVAELHEELRSQSGLPPTG